VRPRRVSPERGESARRRIPPQTILEHRNGKAHVRDSTTRKQNDIRKGRGLHHPRWYVADEPCGYHCEQREAQCALKKRVRV
jgi:hypothetical protein